MKNSLYMLLTAFIIISYSSLAEANIFFGKQSDIKNISNIELRGKDSESLYLGRLVTTYFFLLGVYVEDEGYVLGSVKDKNLYYSFPEEKVLANMQKARLLPNPLPEYKITMLEYLIGYSLYIFIILMLLIYGISKKFKKVSK